MFHSLNSIRCEMKIPNDIEFMSKHELRENKLLAKIEDRVI